jgi:hypothetical protein
LCAAACCRVLLDCQPPCSVLSTVLLSFVVRMLADYCSLCESPLTVTWIDLLFVDVSRFLPCRCNSACVNLHLQACNVEADMTGFGLLVSCYMIHVWCTCYNAQHLRYASKIVTCSYISTGEGVPTVSGTNCSFSTVALYVSRELGKCDFL